MIAPAQPDDTAQGRAAFLRRFVLRPHATLCAVILTGVVLEAAYYAGVPFTFRFIVDDALLGGNHSLLVKLIGGLVTAAITVACIGLGRDYLYARLSSTVMTEVRMQLFEQVQRQSMAFFSATPSGDILARFTTDILALERAAAGLIAWSILPSLDVLAGTVLLFILSWKLALVSLLVWPLTVATPAILARRLAGEASRKNQAEAAMLGLVQENLSAQMVIQTFGLVDFARRGYFGRLQALREQMVRVSLLSSMVERSAYVGVMLLQVTLLGFGAFMVSRGSLTVGALAAFQTIFLSLSYSLASLTQFIPTLVQAGAGIEGIQHLLAQQPQVPDSGSAATIAHDFREICFEEVDFGYTRDAKNLNQFSATLPSGSFIGVVGESGSGKSTLLTLLTRLYDPSAGRVTIDGRDIREFPLEQYRALFGYVPQESFLFDISIRENIRLGKPSATDVEVEAAARLAEVHDAILSLPEGYGTLCGQRGGRLSGGQRQRVALARALVRNPAVLILDEATSALDPATEAAIHETFERLRVGRTILSVTHRLSTVATADRILVIGKGRLVQQGTHRELTLCEGPYQTLWTRQQGLVFNTVRHQAGISIDRLRLVPVFYGFSDDLLREAVRLFQTEEHPPGFTLMIEGDLATSFYIIVRGSVELTSTSTRPVVLEDGDSFGESALLEDSPHGDTVRTLTPCVFLTLSRAAFEFLASRRDGTH